MKTQRGADAEAPESGAVKRSICRRRLEQGREASGSPREDSGSMGAWPVKDSNGVLRVPVVSQAGLQRSLAGL